MHRSVLCVVSLQLLHASSSSGKRGVRGVWGGDRGVWGGVWRGDIGMWLRD